MSTLTIDVTDLSVSKLSTINIAVINQPNPVTGYTANADEVYQLINIPKYRILVSGTNTPVTGENYYTYFPEKNPGGGGGGGGGGGDGYTKAETDALLNGKVDKVTGKGLSTNDFTNEDKTKVTNAISTQDVQSLIDASQTSQEASFVDITAQEVDDIYNDTANKITVTESNGDVHYLSSLSELTEYISTHAAGNMYEVEFGKNITEAIPDEYFRSNNRVTSIIINGPISSIGKYAFSACANLHYLDFRNCAITEIPANLCYASSNVEYFGLPDTVKTIYGGAFASTFEIKTIGSDTFVFPRDLETIKGGAFSATDIEHITFNDKISTIENGAISNATGRTSTHTITFPNTDHIQEIAAYAFSGCLNVQTITVNASEGSIANAPWGAKNNGGSSNPTVVWTG